MSSRRSKYSGKKRGKYKVTKSAAAAGHSRSRVNPAINYKFHLILASILQKEGVILSQLEKKLIKNLDETAPDRFERSELHQRMTDKKTLEAAREKTENDHYLMSYLLDRWSRVTGGERKPHVLKKMFDHKPRIRAAIDKICDLHLKCDWSKCGKRTPVHLEINPEGELITLCRDCENERKKNRRKCPTKPVTKGEIRSLLQRMPEVKRTRKRSIKETSSDTDDELSGDDDDDDDDGDEITPTKKQKIDIDSDEESKNGADDVIRLSVDKEDKVNTGVKVTDTDTAEYKTIIKCTAKLITAIKSNITALSGHLLSNELISSDNDTDLRNTQLSELDRASKLVALVRSKVQLSPANFHKFIGILEEEKQNFENIIADLKETLDCQKEECSSSQRGSLKVEKERFMTYLRDHISEEDCTVLEGEGICSFELLYLFTEEEIDQMDKLTVAGKKFIAKEIKESAVTV